MGEIVLDLDGMTANSPRERTAPVRYVQFAESEEAAFTLIARNVAIGNNKSMLSILNADATVHLRIHEIFVINAQTASVTGVVSIFEFFNFTGHTGGTQLTTTPAAAGQIKPHDSTDALDGDVTVRTGASISGEVGFSFRKVQWSSDEHGTGTLDQEGHDKGFQQAFPIYKKTPGLKPLIIRPNEGIHIKHTVNSTNGTFDIVAVVSQV